MVLEKRIAANSLNKKFIIALGALFSLIPLSVEAQAPTFHSVYGSNMVLPYDKPFFLSGNARPNESLKLEVDGARYSISSNESGMWQLQISSLPVGGPYSLKITNSSGQSATLDNVLAGELWLCSGQSNMAYSVSASADQPQNYNQGHPSIRFLQVPLHAELSVQDEFTEKPVWQEATDESTARFSAVCYFTARQVFEDEGIPLGLINASWGGSAIEAWISENGLRSVGDYGRKVNQLQQFREHRRDAELAFSDDWVSWWQANSDQGPVWEQGVLDKKGDWRDAPLTNWKTYPDERLANHHGILWFSTSFALTNAQQKKNATFVLGKIDEVDSTWINGKFVNNTFGYGTKREYPLEAGVLQKGANQITVNVLNTWDVGGMLGPQEEVGLLFEDGEFLPLGTGWKYRFIPRETGQPPRSPWESVSGISGMFNGMISPLFSLQPAVAIWYQGESNAENSSSYQELLQALISDWRIHFREELPFVIVQLPNYGSEAATPGESGWATIRNAEQQVALSDDRIGLVVTHDVGDDADIHPRQKYVVGMRAAEVIAALKNHSGNEDGVVATVAEASRNSISLHFAPTLQATEGKHEIEGFVLCNSARTECVETSADLEGTRLDISTREMRDADQLRYCWSDGGQCELKADNGLPVSSFQLELTR